MATRKSVTEFKGFTSNDNYKNRVNIFEASANAVTTDTWNGIVISSVNNLASGAVNTIVMTNSAIKDGAQIYAIVNYAGSEGTPVLAYIDVEEGEVSFTVRNLHASQALNAGYSISYHILTNPNS
jgi:hypothetical protein